MGVLYGTGDTAVTVEAGKNAAAAIPMRRLSPLLSTIEEFTSWIDEAAYIDLDAGGSVAVPIPLRMALELTDDPDEDGIDNYNTLLALLGLKGKYAALDLSACTMGGDTTLSDAGISDADPGRNAGRGMVVSLVLPDVTTTIDSGSGVNVFGLSFIRLTSLSGKYVTTIGEGALSGCSSLTTVSFLRVETIGQGALSGCTSLASIDFPDSLSEIGRDAFAGCTSLTSIDLPISLITLGRGAFSHCTSLVSIDLPPSLTVILNDTFGNCTSLTSIDLPASLTSIGGNSFGNCSLLSVVISRKTTPPSLSNTAFNYGSPAPLTDIYVPDESVDAYKAASGWSSYAGIIKALSELSSP
jgi:hypothetical protein